MSLSILSAHRLALSAAAAALLSVTALTAVPASAQVPPEGPGGGGCTGTAVPCPRVCKKGTFWEEHSGNLYAYKYNGRNSYGYWNYLVGIPSYPVGVRTISAVWKQCE